MAVEAESDSDNNPPQLRLLEVCVVVVVVVARDVDYYHQQPETKKVVVEVDNFVVGCYILLVVEEDIVGAGFDSDVVGDLVDFLRRVFSGESGRFGSLMPSWAIIPRA